MSAPEAEPVLVQLGQYQLVAELARGGMGVVYLALTRGPGGFSKFHVVKALKAHLVEEPGFVEMFLEEARLAARLSHPNVVQTVEVRSEGSHHFIAMEFLDGQSLDRLLRRLRRKQETLPLPYYLHIMTLVLEALEYAHSVSDFDGQPLNLVHRDVTPHNVFIGYDGQVKLLDFGIAKARDSSNNTSTGVVKGKVRWMAPEQATGRAIDRRADLFSVGVMLFEAFTETPMWDLALNEGQILTALVRGEIPTPSERKPEIDPVVDAMIRKATAADPAERYATAAEFQAALHDYIEKLALARGLGRKVGKVVSDEFDADRTRLNGVIEKILKDVRAGKSIVPPRLGQEGAGSGARIRSGSGPGTGSGASSHASVASSDLRPNRGRLGVLVFAAALVAIIAFLLVRRRPEAAKAPPIAVSGPTIPTPAPTPTPVRITIATHPREASIFIDENAPVVGVFTGSFHNDGALHTIRVEAPKFQSKRLTFQADIDRAFDVSLEAVPTAVAQPAPVPVGPHTRPRSPNTPNAPSSTQPVAPATVETATAAPTPTPTTVAPTPTPAERKKQPINKNDPYGNPTP